MDSKPKFMTNLMPFFYVVLIQSGNAGFSLIAKAALNEGSSHYTFSVYRSAIAALVLAPFALILDRKTRPVMTLGAFLKIMLLGLLDPVVGQNLFYEGMKYTTPTVTAALCNVIPALTFLVAWIFRIEKVNMKKLASHAMICGTVVTLGGAMLMTIMKGHVVELPWTHHAHSGAPPPYNPNDQPNPIKGAIMISAGCLFYSIFFIVMSITSKTYHCGLSLTALICTMGALEGTLVTLVAERGSTTVWKLGWNLKLLAYVYGGVVSSGITYYLSGAVMKTKGPVFLTAFQPLSMIMVAILSSFIFSEKMSIGKITGSLVIVIGLYIVVWGKSKQQKEQFLDDEISTKTDNFHEADAV